VDCDIVVLGTLLGNFRVVDQLGAGGMGVVYVGQHEALGRPVVMKVLQPELCGNAEMVQRFFDEARAVTAVRSPGIVQMFDFGVTADHRAYLVMELLEGESLAARLKQCRFDHAAICRLGRQIANVLQAAHAAAIIHGDLKPANLFLVPDPEIAGGERVKVLDFCIARLAGEAQFAGVRTRSGLMLGTHHYVSPEQCRSPSTADARSDIYALGCILFEMACGRPPFVFTGIGDLVAAHLDEPPPHPHELAPGVPPGLSALIAQMLAKSPDERPQAMATISQALDEILHALDPVAVAASTLFSAVRASRPSLPGLPPAYPVARPDAPTTVAPPTPLAVAPPAPPAIAPPAIAEPVDTPRAAAPGPLSSATAPRRRTRAFAARRALVRRLTYAFGALAIVGAAAEIAFLASDRPGRSEQTVPYADIEEARAGNTAADGTPIADRVAECRRSQTDRNWTALAQCADQLRPLDPRLAAELGTRAAEEARSAPHVVAARAALSDGTLKQARAGRTRSTTPSSCAPTRTPSPRRSTPWPPSWTA
jgi:serine/threonine-protein kinase